MIGFYDSGIGGRRISDVFQQLRPEIAIQYFADIESLPLGDKSPEYIRQRVIQGVERLFNQGCTLVVLACNTASVYTIRYIQSEWLPQHYPDKQVLGVTVPLREYMDTYLNLKSQKGLLMATQATINTGFYQDYLGQAGYQITALGCPGLADAIELDMRVRDHGFTQSSVRITELFQTLDIDYEYLILACTHYGYITFQLKLISGLDVIIDPYHYIAQRLDDYLSRHLEYYIQ